MAKSVMILSNIFHCQRSKVSDEGICDIFYLKGSMHIIILSCPVSNLRQICLLHDKAPSYTFKIKSNPVQLFPFQESYYHYYSQQALGSEISQFLRGLPNHCIMTHLTNGFIDRNCLSQTAGNTIDVI